MSLSVMEFTLLDPIHLRPSKQGGSKLLSGFPWPIISKPEARKQNCLRNMKV
jgi:hypothetical protein